MQSELRTRILLYLLSTNVADMAKIRENVGATKASVWANMGVLEHQGLVECDTPEGERHGKAPRFWISPDMMVDLLAEYLTLYPTSIRAAVLERLSTDSSSDD